MKDKDDRLLKDTRVIVAWLAIMVAIVIAAAIGILGGKQTAVTTILAAIAAFMGLVAAVETLQSNQKIGSVLAATAALIAAAGLIVNQSDWLTQIRLSQVFTDICSKDIILVIAILVVVLATVIIMRWNDGTAGRQGRGCQPGT